MMTFRHCRPVICVLAAWLVTVAAVCGCAPAGRPQDQLMVFAAMSLKKPMTEITQSYEVLNPGVKVNLNFAGSSTLVAQVIAGAPADVFAPASRQDMDRMVEKGLVDNGTLKVFAANRVVLVVSINSAWALKGFEDLALDNVRRIAVGNPKMAPVGVYGEEALVYFGLEDRVRDKLIYCDQVAQVCDYTASGEVDAGIVYLTDYLARKSQLVLVAEAPRGSHKPVEYPAAVLRQSINKQGAGRFIDLLCSEQCQAVLSANGFRPTNGVNR